MSRRRLLLVSLACAWQTVMAWIAGALLAARAGAAYGQHPAGDTVLWREGGLELLDLVARARGDLSTLATGVGAIVGLGTVLGAVPYALLLHDARPGTRARRPRLVDLARAAVPSLPTLVAVRILFLAGAVQLAVAAFFALHLGQAVGASGGGASDARVDVAGWITGLVVLAGLGPLNVGMDAVAAAAVSARRPRLGPALLRAWETLRATGGKLALAWTWRTAAGFLAVAAGAWVASRLGGSGGGPLLVLTATHLLIALVRTALRASWLAALMRRTEPARSRPE